MKGNVIKRVEPKAALKVVTESSVQALCEEEALVLFLLLLFPGDRNVAFLRCMLKSVLIAASINSQKTDALCAALVGKGFVKCVRKMATADARDYKVHARFTAGALATLRDRAVANKWFPHAVEIRSAYETARRYGGYESSCRYECFPTAVQRAVTLRTLLGAFQRFAGQDETVTSDGAFDAACFLTGYLADDANALKGALKGPVDVRLLPAALSAFFCAGRDVGGILDAIKEAVEKDEALRFPAGAVLTYGALRVWRGEILELDGIESWMIPEDGLRMQGAETAFKCAAAGEWEAANTTFSGLVSSHIVSDGNPMLLPFLALVFSVGLQVGMPEAKFRKIARIMRKSLPAERCDDRWSHDPLREKVFAWASERIVPFEGAVSLAQLALDSSQPFLDSSPASFAAVPCAFAFRVSRMQAILRGRDDTCKGLDNLLKQADKALSAGYPLLGSVLLAGYSRFGNVQDPEYARASDMVAKSRVPQLLPVYEQEEEWKALVRELSKIVGDGAHVRDKEIKDKKGTVVWGFQFNHIIYDDAFDEMEEGLSVITCTELAPYYRGPRGAHDGSDDRRMSVKGILGKAYQNLLTEQDRRVLDEIQKTRYNPLRDRSVPASILEALVDHPNTIEVFPGGFYYGELARGPRVMTFTRLSWHVTSMQIGTGELSLSLPPYLGKAIEGPRIVRFGLCDFRYLKLSERERAFVSNWFALAPDGEVRLPSEALKEASPILASMAKLVPMEGNFSSIADTSGLERVPGETVPTVRLAFKDDVLSCSLCLKPYAKNAAFVVKPGVGAPERMVEDWASTRVLVRNLASEKAAAKRVAEALADFDSWADGENAWTVENLVDALGVLATLKDLGEAVRLEWLEGSRLVVVTKIANKGGLKSTGGADRWFRVDGAFEIDEDQTLSLMELLKAFRRRMGRFVVLGDAKFLRISAALAKRLEALEAAGRERDGGLAVAPAALPMLDRAFSDKDGGDALPKDMAVEAGRIREAFAARHSVPPRLKATLRPYQEEGYVWLAQLADCGFGACLADDMGLGKTVQLIALLLAHAKDGASLVVAPTSVGGNWRREIERFAPTLRCLCAWEGDNADCLKAGPHDVVIVSYGMLVAREEKFLSREWNGVVLDEAQAIKNEATERARTVKKLVAKFRVAATGTPIENRLTELWSIFDFLNPGMLGTSNEFIAKLTEDGHATSALKNLVKPLILRRLKREVLDDLPDKTEITLTVPLDETERAGYEACRRKALETLAEGGGGDNRISILAELTRLRRYCCHPSLVMPEMSESAKMEQLVELLRDLKGGNHRVLVFSQFTDYLALVEQRIAAEGFTYQYLDGATPPKERERRVADFQKGEGDVFLMSLKAGGTGLNLTAANYVILLDPWWNPAVEDQAADRVHRIGQKQPVTVYRLIAADTVEERVLELHAEKKQLATDVLDGTGSSALTPEALMKLFG